MDPPGGAEKAGRDGSVRLRRDFDAAGLAAAVAAAPDVLKDKSGKTLNRVQNGLNLQLITWSAFRGLARFRILHLTRTSGDELFGFNALDALALSMGGGGERRRLPNSSSRRRRSPRVTDSPAPAQPEARQLSAGNQALV